MRLTPLGLSLLAAATGALGGDAGTPTFVISATLIGQAHYCGGGARPTDEMIRNAQRSYPIGLTELRVVAGERITTAKPARTVTTDRSGRFELRLPKGSWCLFRAGRQLKAEDERQSPRGQPGPQPAIREGIDKTCLDEVRHRCDEVLKVTRSQTVQVEILEGCPEAWNQPCYRGPMPP